MSLLDFLEFLWREIARNSFYYFGIVAAVFVTLTLWRWRAIPLRIRADCPHKPQMARETVNSIRTIVVFVIWGTIVTIALQTALPGLRQHYDSMAFVAHPSLVAIIVTVLLGLVLQDTYFYWTHRLLHWGPVFRTCHLEHHRSHNPSPLAAYSFSILEAMIQSTFVVLFFFLLPVPGAAATPFIVFNTLVNVLGHSGVEVFPRIVVSNRRFGWVTGVVHHDIHHARARYNFALYFRFWDRIMGTEEPSFVQIYESVRSKGNDGTAYQKLLAPARPSR